MRKIVLIEDNEEIVRALTRLLSRDGTEVRTTPDYDWADLLVIDLALPQGDGVEVAVRARALAPETPILFITGLPDARLGPFASSLEPYRVLPKPFGAEAFRAAVAQLT